MLLGAFIIIGSLGVATSGGVGAIGLLFKTAISNIIHQPIGYAILFAIGISFATQLTYTKAYFKKGDRMLLLEGMTTANIIQYAILAIVVSLFIGVNFLLPVVMLPMMAVLVAVFISGYIGMFLALKHLSARQTAIVASSYVIATAFLGLLWGISINLFTILGIVIFITACDDYALGISNLIGKITRHLCIHIYPIRQLSWTRY